MNEWYNNVNSLIDAYKRATPLVVTKTNPGTYSTSSLTTSGDAANTTLYVEGAIVPNYKLEQNSVSQTYCTAQAYTKARDTSGVNFTPEIGDIVTAEQDYRIMKVSAFQVGSVNQAFILDLGV